MTGLTFTHDRLPYHKPSSFHWDLNITLAILLHLLLLYVHVPVILSLSQPLTASGSSVAPPHVLLLLPILCFPLHDTILPCEPNTENSSPQIRMPPALHPLVYLFSASTCCDGRSLLLPLKEPSGSCYPNQSESHFIPFLS